MGACALKMKGSNKNSKPEKRQGKIRKTESFYEIYQENYQFKTYIDLKASTEVSKRKSKVKSMDLSSPVCDKLILKEPDCDKIRPFNCKMPGLLEESIILSFKNSESSVDYPNVSIEPPEMNQSNSDLLPMILTKSKSELQSEEPVGLLDPKNEFVLKIFQTHLKNRQESFQVRKRGPRRLTQYGSSTNFTIPDGNLKMLEIPEVKDLLKQNESMDEAFLNSALLPESSQGTGLSVKNKGFIRSMASYELEILDFNITEPGKIIVFYVPYLKTVLQKTEYNQTIINYSDFNCFYKTLEICKNSFAHNNKLLRFFPNRWENGEIPYTIDKILMFIMNQKNDSLYNVVLNAIDEVKQNTNINFVKFTPEKHSDYLHFLSGKENKSFVGRHSGKNPVFLNSKADIIHVLHQLMHCLGFMHQHQKRNREFFLYLNKNQISNSNFLQDNCHACIAGIEQGPYDFNSVLNFKSCENMVSYLPIGDSDVKQLSTVDKQKIKFFYNDEILADEEDAGRELNFMRKSALNCNSQVLRRMNTMRKKLNN